MKKNFKKFFKGFIAAAFPWPAEPGGSFRRGFTLAEILVALFGFAIVLMGLVSLISNVFISSSAQSSLLADSDQARRLAFGIIDQIRNAQVSSTGAYSLEAAGDQEVIFYSNADRDPLIERLRYFVQDGKVYRGVVKPSGSPLAYNLANEELSMVQANLANGSEPLFLYYDGSYGGSYGSPLAQPVNVTAVRFIQVALKIYNKAGKDAGNAYSVTAGGTVRNLKDNLGEGSAQAEITYRLDTAVSPAGAGSVAVSPAGPDYVKDTLVNISAYPAMGYVFSGWTGGATDPGAQATTVVMDSDRTLTASFNPVPPTLDGSINSRNGPQSARRWTIRFYNPNSYWVEDVYLNSFSLTQTAGSACSPSITIPSEFPAFVGDLWWYGGRNYQVTINFSGCSSAARFRADFAFAGNNGSDYGIESVSNLPY